MSKTIAKVMSVLTIRRFAGAMAAATVALSAAPAVSQAAQPGDLCYTHSWGLLYLDANTVMTVPAGSLIRILDYRGPYHYLARYSNTVGQFERVHVNQGTCG